MITSNASWPAWACPEHSLPLARQGSSLVCPRGHEVSAHKGIFRFAAASHVEAFGLQWNLWRKTQFDSYTNTTVTEDRLLRVFGDRLVGGLENQHVLECGCGAGRFTEVLLARGARVTSIDLSLAVEANAEEFPQNHFHRTAQADIQRLPFGCGQFDVVMCLGVLQHVPSPEETVAALYSQVKPGGWLVVDHYTHNLSWYTKSAPLFRQILRRMPPERSLAVTQTLVDRLLPLHRRAARVSRMLHMMLSRFSPVQSYYTQYPQLDDALQREWAHLDTYDALTTAYHHFRTRGQVRRMFERSGAINTWCEHGGNGVEARGQRPASVSDGL